MDDNNQTKKTIEKLARTLERLDKSNWAMFKRGFWYGVGYGLGWLVIWTIVLTVLFGLLDRIGVFDTIAQNLETLRGWTNFFAE